MKWTLCYKEADHTSDFSHQPTTGEIDEFSQEMYQTYINEFEDGETMTIESQTSVTYTYTLNPKLTKDKD